MSDDATLFPTIGSAEMRQSIALGRLKRTRRIAWLKAQLSAASGGTVAGKEDGLGNSPAGQPPLARGVVHDSILSPAATQPNIPRGDDVSGNGTATGGTSCSVSRATAGRDRRNFWESAPVLSQVGGVKPQPCGREAGAGAPASFSHCALRLVRGLGMSATAQEGTDRKRVNP